MLEIIATTARWSQLTANLIVFGSCIFIAMIAQHKADLENVWIKYLDKSFPWLSGLTLLGLFGILATTTADATNDTSNAWHLDAWIEMVRQTQIGQIWVARALLAALLLSATLVMQRMPRQRWHYAACTVIAALPLIAGTLMSHSSADEMSVTAVAPYALHILFAGMWFGALPAFVLILFNRHQGNHPDSLNARNVAYLQKFSAIALPAMILLALTGLIVTDRLVDTQYYTLVSSAYGWLLIAKLSVLAIILVIAYQARNKWLPRLAASNQNVTATLLHLRQWIRIEWILALILALLATILANTLPAKHSMIDNWPYPFRFSIDATWDQLNVPELVWTGVALFILALGMFALGLYRSWHGFKKTLIPGLLMLSSLALALPPLAIKAFPETYKKPTDPIDAISIVTGANLFAEHCVNCHGPQGKGTKPVADPDLRDPTDLLTQQHTASYTVGNVFHEISQGIPGTEMPGFADRLSEEDRWDLINFLHALSRGFDARLLGTMILPETPAIASAVFTYTNQDGSSGNLKDFRLQKNVVLVLFSWPQSKQRFFQLAASYDTIRALDTEILAVPQRALSSDELQQIAEIVPFPIVTEGWSEIKNSYWFYRRIRTVPDLSGKGMHPEHMEFLTDRFGYLRARWVAQFEGLGWQNISTLTSQFTQLNQEKEIMPPPGDHAH